MCWKLTLPFQLSQIVPILTDCDNSAENEKDIGKLQKLQRSRDWRHGGSTMRFSNWSCKLCPRRPCQDLQVQVVDQTTHPPKCHSFVGLERQIGSSPPASFSEMRKHTCMTRKSQQLRKTNHQWKKTSSGRSFTSIQFHTHTSKYNYVYIYNISINNNIYTVMYYK